MLIVSTLQCICQNSSTHLCWIREKGYALTFPFDFETLDLTFDLQFANYSGLSPVILIRMDEDNQTITEDYGIVEDYSIQKTRPLFYISNSSHFISIHLNYNNEVIPGRKYRYRYPLTYNFGVPSDISNLK